jgi:hypothetical protein
MKRKRPPRRGALDFGQVVAAHAHVAALDDHWRRDGYERGGARAFRRRDGTFTVRLVWRKRDASLSTFTCTLRALALP